MNWNEAWRRERESIDRAATALYDRLNPNWDIKINVSKADCIKRVEAARERRRERAHGQDEQKV